VSKAPPSATRCLAEGRPPPTLEGTVGALGLVEPVELGHVLAGQGEVEYLPVLADPLTMSRLGDDHKVVLEAPPQ
jgi:hypothetical protein